MTSPRKLARELARHDADCVRWDAEAAFAGQPSSGDYDVDADRAWYASLTPTERAANDAAVAALTAKFEAERYTAADLADCPF